MGAGDLRKVLKENPWSSCEELCELMKQSEASVRRLLMGLRRDKEVQYKWNTAHEHHRKHHHLYALVEEEV